MKDLEAKCQVELTHREMNLIIMAMSASQVPVDLQKEVFELVQKFRTILGEAT